MAEALVEYVLEIVGATRTSGRLLIGVSPRASLGLVRASQALALLEGRDYVVPDDVKRLVIPTLAHRLVAAHSTHARASEEALVELLDTIPVP